MRNILSISILLATLFSCGDKKSEANEIKLLTFKDKLSYTLGADHARAISESGDPNFDKYNIDEILKGFEIGLKDEKSFDEACKQTMGSLFGQDGNNFNAKFVNEGSNCIGKISGIFFVSGWKQKQATDKIDMSKVITGFEHGLRKIDTLVPRTEQGSLIQNFMADLNKLNGEKMFVKAKKLKNTQITPSGIILETIEEGKGSSPAVGDDVLSHYIVMNSKGDTLQNSLEMVEKYNMPLKAFSLSGVVQGWQEGFPMMKKGGKYRLYVPYNLAYGEQGMFNQQTNSFDIQPFESLVFYIDFINFGKPGSLTSKDK